MKYTDTSMEMNKMRDKYLKIPADILENARKQFCADTCLSWEDYIREPGKKVYIQKTAYEPGRICVDREDARRYSKGDAFFNAIICLGQLFLTVDECIYEWAVAEFEDCKPEWFCSFDNLRKIDRKLQEYGRQIGDTHLYFLPSQGILEESDTCVRKSEINGLPLEWYEEEEIERFRDGNRFPHALGYLQGQPDVLAVAALREGERYDVEEAGTRCGEEAHGAEQQDTEAVQGKVYDQNAMAGMSGVSRDGTYLWQVGINVDKEMRGRGLAAGLVKELTMELLRRGVTPFYGTGEAHSISRSVALKAGYVPAFASVYAVRADS
ncbi:MAG: hypothetical protein IKL04_07140 [Lachnospiraceae bacterium]|nr:hypothetical protein [Lachnospiraceae bacterium]